MPEVRTDAREFELSVRQGHRALADGDDERGVRLLSDGLALWRGPALGDVRTSGTLRAEALRLDVSTSSTSALARSGCAGSSRWISSPLRVIAEML
ncbi:BTAD domain-containing putative transcriptional regulator [Streptomyces albidoflavus]